MTALGALMLCAPLACSDLDPLDDTCLTVEGANCDPPDPPDAELPLEEAKGPWDCLGNVPPRQLPDPRPAGIAFIVPIVDFENPPQAPPNLEIRVCQLNDFDCARPLPIQPISPDPDRAYIHQFNLPFGFEGYLRLNAPDYIQSEYYFLGPMIGGPNGEPVVYGDGIGLPKDSAIDNFFVQFRTPRLPNTALVALRVFDCTNELPATQAQRREGIVRRASGTTLELAGVDAIPWTLIGGQPVANDPPSPTDGRGVAGFANIAAPGALSVEAIAPDGTRYGTTGFNIRPNQLTQANVRPNYTYAD